MGHREALLEGARKCLYERGYARTTARDIVAASGTNLASIGYHFGSKEALLNAAMVQAFDEWGDRLTEAFLREPICAAGPIARFEAGWARIIEAIEAHRPLWIALFQALAQTEHSPEMRTFLAGAMQHGREQIAANLERAGQPAFAARERIAAAFNQALLIGLMAQLLVDPEHAPTGRDFGAALRVILTEDAPEDAPSPARADAAPRPRQVTETARGAHKARGAGKAREAGKARRATKAHGARKTRGDRKR